MVDYRELGRYAARILDALSNGEFNDEDDNLQQQRKEPSEPTKPVTTTTEQPNNNNSNDDENSNNRCDSPSGAKSRQETAMLHLVTRSKNWGQQSPMLLAAKSNCDELITHELCDRVVNRVWYKGKVPLKVSAVSARGLRMPVCRNDVLIYILYLIT